MSRRMPPACPLLPLAFWLGSLTVPAAAQAPVPNELADLTGEANLARELARATFDAVHADPKDLARQRLEAARAGFQAAWEEFLAGRGMLDVLTESSQRLLDAELGADPAPAAQLLALERQWETAVVLDLIQDGRYNSGRVSVADHAAARYFRRDAELRWARARQGQPGAAGHARRSPWTTVELPGPEGEVIPEKELARARFEALHAAPADLARDRREAAREGYRARAEEFLAGRGTLDLLLQALRQLTEADLAVDPNPPERAAALESSWAQAWEIEKINEARYDAGRVPVADLLATRYVRLDAEVRWLQARPPGGKTVAGPFRLVPEDDLGDALPRPRDFAEAKRAAERADVRDLLREKRSAARQAFRCRWEEFAAGRGTLDLVEEQARRVLDAELALDDRPAARAAAWQRYWAWTWLVETVDEARFEAGRVPVRDLMASRYLRLDAAIHWAEARARADREKK
jgi:hypothetical protein